MSNLGNSNSNDDPAYKKLREDNKGITPSAPPAPPGALFQGLPGSEYEYKEGDEDHEGPELKGLKKQKQKQKQKLTQKSKKSVIQTNKANLAPLIEAIKKLNASDKAIFKCHGTEFQFRQISDSDDLACMITWCKEVGSDKKPVQPTQVTITSTYASGGSNIEENLEAILVANKLIANGNNDQINNQNKGDFLYIDWDEANKKGQIDSMRKYINKMAQADGDLKDMAVGLQGELNKYDEFCNKQNRSNLKEDFSRIQAQGGAGGSKFVPSGVGMPVGVGDENMIDNPLLS